MAVFDRQYQPWEGRRTGRLERLLVLPRYAYRGIFSSKLFTAFFTAAFLPFLAGAAYIWIRSNVTLLQQVGADVDALPAIDGQFFLFGLYLQLWYAAVLTLLQGPALVSPDLVNGALPLFLSRPVSRSQYVLGKFLVLALLLSAITWVPLSLLFLLQASLSETPWMLPNIRLLFGVIAGSAVAITTFSLFALALSAWIKSKAFTRAFVAGFLFIPAGFGEVINGTLHTKMGDALNLVAVLEATGAALLGVKMRGMQLPVAVALLSLAVVASLSFLLLNRRLRAYEVVAS